MLLMIGSTDVALAQSTATRPPSFGAAPQMNQGAANAPQFGIRAGADVTYDSNVFGVGNGLARRGTRAGRSQGDFSVTPSLQLDVVRPIGRQSAFVRGQIGYDFFVDNTQLNRERINLEAGANLQLPRACSAVVSGTFGRFRSNAGDVFAISPIPVVNRTNTEERISYGGQAQCGVIGLSPSLGYRHTEVRNTSDFFQINDSDQDVYDASIGYERPSLGRIAIYGSYAKSSFLNRTILGIPGPIPGVPNDGVTSYTAGGRYERSIGSRASGAISIGYSWVDPDTLFSRRFRGNSYSLSLNLRPSDKLSVDVAVSRSADLSNTAFATFAVTDVYTVNTTYRLTPRLAANFGASHQIRDYRGNAQSIDQVAFLTGDEFTRAYGGLVFNLNRRLRLNALVSQQRRKSDNALFNYGNTTVSLGASLSLGR